MDGWCQSRRFLSHSEIKSAMPTTLLTAAIVSQWFLDCCSAQDRVPTPALCLSAWLRCSQINSSEHQVLVVPLITSAVWAGTHGGRGLPVQVGAHGTRGPQRAGDQTWRHLRCVLMSYTLQHSNIRLARPSCRSATQCYARSRRELGMDGIPLRWESLEGVVVRALILVSLLPWALTRSTCGLHDQLYVLKTAATNCTGVFKMKNSQRRLSSKLHRRIQSLRRCFKSSG